MDQQLFRCDWADRRMQVRECLRRNGSPLIGLVGSYESLVFLYESNLSGISASGAIGS
jgi:hypothetical protein